jgi:hypothetical protein
VDKGAAQPTFAVQLLCSPSYRSSYPVIQRYPTRGEYAEVRNIQNAGVIPSSSGGVNRELFDDGNHGGGKNGKEK